MPKKAKAAEPEIVNWYEKMDKSLLVQAENPNFDIIDNEKDNVSNGFKITLRPNQKVKLPTGLFLNCEELKKLETSATNISNSIRYTPVLKIYPRSSTGVKLNLELSNTVAIIDVDYTKEIMILFRNIGTDNCIISHGDVLVQGEFSFCFRPDDMINNDVRSDGFGSTGN